METLEDRCEFILNWAREETDYFLDFNLETPEKYFPDYLKSLSENPALQAILLADISFKLYILHHTKTENDVQKLRAYTEILMAFRELWPDPKLKHSFDLVIYQLKIAYPVLEDDKVLHDIRDFFWGIIEKDSERCNPVNLFLLSMRLCNYLAENSVAMVQCMKALRAQKERSIESHPQWDKIKPVFEAYAKELETNPKAKFGVYFHGKQADRLEGILRGIGEWNDAIKDESESKASERNYKRWKANFNRWYERNSQEGRVQQLVAAFEKSFWKRTRTEKTVQSITKHLNLQNEKFDSTVIDEFKKLSMELSQKLQTTVKED